jgi:serine/threonine protein phosphatase 1
MDIYRNAIVAGDIHGQLAPLQALLQQVRAKEKPLILLGDYVNRGPQSREVLDVLVGAAAEREDGRFVFLMGNHERELLKFLDGGPLEDFATHGGLATLKSYLSDHITDDPVSAFRDEFDPHHRDFLESLPSFLETGNYLFSHTGFDPSDVFLRTDAAVAGRGTSRIFSHPGPWPKRCTFLGHFVQANGEPFISPHLICLDTGCGTIPGRPLTAFDIESGEILQFSTESHGDDRDG